MTIKGKYTGPAVVIPSSAQWDGFTLIELLIAITNFIIIISIVGACLLSGMRVLNKVQYFNRHESNAILAMDLLSTELRSTFEFSGIPFTGKGSRISFSGIVEDKYKHRKLGAISYELQDRSLLRRSSPYLEESSCEEKLVENIIGVMFDYKYLATDMGPVCTGLPSRIDFEIILDDEGGPKKISRTLWIPVRGGP